MAAALAAAKLGSAAVVRSAGVECGSGLPAARNAVKVMSERGLDISNHSSIDVEDLDMNEFDIVVAMSPEVARRLARLNPKRLDEWSVTDPYGGDIATYRAAADAIDTALEGFDL
jgi:protein-tyrosine-phosphatase